MSKKAEPTIAEQIAKLDEIVAWFESDSIDLDKALEKYEEGLTLVKKLEAYLATAKNTVTKIDKKFS